MNAFRRNILWLAVRGMIVVMLELRGAVAGVVLQPETTIEFATVQQGREVLGKRDEFIQMMSPFDRCVRMKTGAAVTEAQFLAYIQNQVQTWTVAEQIKVSNIVVTIRAPLESLNLSLPATIQLIKTTGNEEGNAAYVRGTSIIFPQVMVSSSSNYLTQVVTHELFHVYTWHHPPLRAALYGVLGVRLGNEIPFPPWLLARRIACPNPPLWDFALRVKVARETCSVMPMFLYSRTNYTSGGLFDYLASKLLVLEETPGGLRAKVSDAGEPTLLDFSAVSDFYEQIGNNTSYNIHPEETLADNFMQVVLGIQNVNSPRIHHLLRAVLLSGSSPGLTAGRFTGVLNLPDGQPRVLEISTDLVNWRVWDAFTNTTGGVEVCDPTAWLGRNRFFRARTGELPLLQPGDTNHLAWIPPGTFLMGSPTNEAGRSSNEGPQRRVTLTRGFWMGKFEVTQSEFQQVMGTNPSSCPGLWSQPVENVTWAEATNYCGQLTQQEQTAGRLPPGFAYRLPTEAEWEYAARAGTTNRFSYGDDPDFLDCYEQMWFADNTRSRPHSVGTSPANPWGLYDLHGNISELCQDWYGSYSGTDVTDPQGPATGSSRVIRGGDWRSGSLNNCRSAARAGTSPTRRYSGIGFRVMLVSSTP